jgi:hypothetical protein
MSSGRKLTQNLADEFAGASDVGDGDFTGVRFRSWIREPCFFGDEGDGVVRADAGPEGLAGVAIHAAREVDGEDGRTPGIDSVDDLIEGFTRWVRQAGAEHGVDNQRRPRGTDKAPGSGGDAKQFHRLNDFEVDKGIALIFIGVTEQKNGDFRAAIVKMPRDSQAVTAIVAATTQNGDGAVATSQAQGKIRRSAGGIFHKYNAGNVEVFNGSAIDLADLGSSESDHECAVKGPGTSAAPPACGLN